MSDNYPRGENWEIVPRGHGAVGSSESPFRRSVPWPADVSPVKFGGKRERRHNLEGSVKK